MRLRSLRSYQGQRYLEFQLKIKDKGPLASEPESCLFIKSDRELHSDFASQAENLAISPGKFLVWA